MTNSTDIEPLVDARRCIELTFDEGSRPALRTWMDWKSKGYIPFLKIGKRVFYSPEDVRHALEKQFKIQSREL